MFEPNEKSIEKDIKEPINFEFKLLLIHLLKDENTLNTVINSKDYKIIYEYASKFDNHPKIDDLTDAFLDNYQHFEYVSYLQDFATIKGVNADKIIEYIFKQPNIEEYTTELCKIANNTNCNIQPIEDYFINNNDTKNLVYILEVYEKRLEDNKENSSENKLSKEAEENLKGKIETLKNYILENGNYFSIKGLFKSYSYDFNKFDYLKGIDSLINLYSTSNTNEDDIIENHLIKHFFFDTYNMILDDCDITNEEKTILVDKMFNIFINTTKDDEDVYKLYNKSNLTYHKEVYIDELIKRKNIEILEDIFKKELLGDCNLSIIVKLYTSLKQLGETPNLKTYKVYLQTPTGIRSNRNKNVSSIIEYLENLTMEKPEPNQDEIDGQLTIDF